MRLPSHAAAGRVVTSARAFGRVSAAGLEGELLESVGLLQGQEGQYPLGPGEGAEVLLRGAEIAEQNEGGEVWGAASLPKAVRSPNRKIFQAAGAGAGPVDGSGAGGNVVVDRSAPTFGVKGRKEHLVAQPVATKKQPRRRYL